MRRVARVVGVGAAALVLVLVPWAGARRAAHEPAFFIDDDRPLLIPPPAAPALAQPIPGPFITEQPHLVGGCGCDTVVINASNTVRDADVRSGSATSINNGVTYVSAAYAARYENEIRVKVRQVARAVSGDVMAGQSIALAAAGGGRCHNFVVKARNVLEDVEVRSGNATAANHSTVLLDPGVDPNRLDLHLHQHALAQAGNATAGQFIAAAGAGAAGGCGSVTVEASNVTDDVTVRSGRALGTNDNTIRTCAEAGCEAELRELAAGSTAVQLCTGDGCHTRRGTDVAATLPPAPAGSAAPPPAFAVPDPSYLTPDLAYCDLRGPGADACRAALTSSSPSPSPTPSATPSPTPTGTPSASPSAKGKASGPSPSPSATPKTVARND